MSETEQIQYPVTLVEDEGPRHPLEGRKRKEPIPIVPASGQKAWHRLKGESIQAYEAFMTYLTLPRDERSIDRACEILSKNRALLGHWSVRNSWVYRVASYEEHHMLMSLESIEARRDNMWVRQEALGETAINIVEAHLAQLMSDMEEMQQANQVKPDALVRLMDTATKIHRMAVKGRVESAEIMKVERARLSEIYAEEMAMFLKSLFQDLNLSPVQEREAKVAMKKFFARNREET